MHVHVYLSFTSLSRRFSTVTPLHCSGHTCSRLTNCTPFLRYYLYQWPLSMTVIVVISIFITLCTCTVLMWVRDVVRDFEIQRSLSIQRRRAMAQQQQQQQQQQEQHDGRIGLQVREMILRQLQVRRYSVCWY